MKQTETTTTQPKRESDGRFALQLKTNTAVQRDVRRQAEREARKAEMEANGEDWTMWA